MERVEPSAIDAPMDALRAVFHLQDVQRDGDRVIYYGESLVPRGMLVREIWPEFHDAGYEVQLARTSGSHDVLVAQPVSNGVDGIPWKNIALLFLTILSTLLVGALAWYYVPVSAIEGNPLVVLRAWPFTAAVLGVLLTHELGHYVVARYHGVDVSLPYVIPFILPFGTMGAIIRMRGQMPDRKALFDIGVAGPLAGLAATIVVTAIGLSLDPIHVPDALLNGGGQSITFHTPPLMSLIANVLNEPTGYSDPHLAASPVIIGGWVGMFFTVLNLLPVGQLDGGHMLRAMLGERQESVAAIVPLALFGISAYLYYGRHLGIDESVGLWAFWGIFSTFIAFNGAADPIDESFVGWGRIAIGVFTFGMGLLCFMLTPITLGM